MGNNKTLFIILGIAVVAAIITFMSGGQFGEGEDPAEALARRQGGGTSAPAPAPEPAPEPEPTPAPEAQPVTPSAGEPVADTAPADESVAEAPAEEEPAAGEEVDAEMPADETVTAEADAAADESGEELIAAAEGEEGLGEEIDSEGLFEEDAEEVPEDPVERFKQMDPRDIILAKYDDLEERLTAPWDENDPDNFIPQTGRVDPLTRVSDAVPDDLKPPRAGETDASRINTYLTAVYSTEAVESAALGVVCHNVLQIGLQKFASFSLGGNAENAFTIQEGRPFGLNVGTSGGFMSVTINPVSISTDLVTVIFSAGTVEKRQSYIPANIG